MNVRWLLIGICAFGLARPAQAHDTWVQTNTNLVRLGDAVYVDLMLGNHGNDHRDFKLASKADAASSTLNVWTPAGKSYDLKERLIDTGYAPKEGFWNLKFVGNEPGLYLVEHALDKVVNHGKRVRSVKSGKTFFVVSKSLDDIPRDNPGFDRQLGHPLELVPVANPVTPMGPGQKIIVRALYQGKPLADARISFIPRGETLAEGFDSQYERRTDANGQASFSPTTGNYYLVVVHHNEPTQSGADYESTSYAATLSVFVPELCPCCGE